MSVAHGQCDARPTVNFPACVCTNLYCLVTEALVCEQLPRIAPESALAGVEPAMAQRPNDYHTKPHRLTQKYTPVYDTRH